MIDATDQVVGRLASKVAKLIRGKYKPTFTPHVDCGDNVILINADKVVFTGKKETDKVYTRYTGYPGGQRFNTPAELRKKNERWCREDAPSRCEGYAAEGSPRTQPAEQPLYLRGYRASPCRSAAKDY